MTRPELYVIRPGPLTTVQDLGRPGLAHLGVGHSGACDLSSFRLANRIVGNDEGAGALELTIGGLSARFTQPTWVALTGAPAPVLVNDRPHSFCEPIHVPAGAVLNVGMAAEGMRSYLAVRGGLAVEPVLGSCSTDLLTGVGPAIVAAGDTIAIAADARRAVTALDIVPVRAIDGDPVVALTAGPRSDWFPPSALETLTSTRWAVSPDSNRIGIRLTGPLIERIDHGELPSEGLVAGAIQVPPSGQPVLFLADHPVTGGYPVIATIDRIGLATAAQVRIGRELRFRLHA